ncbi:MAG: hypothetical protein EZS28_033945 [Streblomastix strix]|uniref:4Fe-4S ferredoxin-type domain-containing protein n=1 Tax=Streblomastix strix TaxID=222440 RepID=A0A5J4UIP9_9EUKA|nr:MAG: hypothetical protein EZS28_033945 [Streblomastix strix]
MEFPYNDLDQCQGCQACASACPKQTELWLINDDGKAVFKYENKDECVQCQACVGACPVGAIQFKAYLQFCVIGQS